nr:EamA family transporter [Pseudonocardia sp. C8]
MLAVVVAVLWGANFIAIHVGLEYFPPVFLAGLRMLVLAVPAVLLVPRPRVPLRWLVGYGLGFGTLQFLFLFLAMYAGMPAGLASLVLQASGPFTLVLGAILLREEVTRRQWAGIGVAVAGLATIALARAQSAALLPVVLTLLGALGWAAGNLCNRLAQRGAQAERASAQRGAQAERASAQWDGATVNPLHLTMWMTVVPPVPLLAASAVVEGPGAGWAAVGAMVTWDGLPGLGALVYLSVVATVLAAGIWTGLMRRYPAGLVAPHSLLVPVVGMTLAMVLLGERPSVVELLAGAVVVGGVLAASAPSRRRAPAEPAATVG